MRINITQIMKATHCTEDHANNVERYINEGDMLDWSEASLRMINSIARAVNDKLLRDAPPRAIRTETITTYSGKKMEVGVLNEAPKAAKKSKAPAKGTKIAHALAIYNEMVVDGVRCSRQDIISALAGSMQIEKHQAAGYYQSCKKKVGA